MAKKIEVTVWLADILCPIFEMRASAEEEFRNREQAVKWVQREIQGEFIWIQNQYVSIHTCYGKIWSETKLVEVEEEGKYPEGEEKRAQDSGPGQDKNK